METGTDNTDVANGTDGTDNLDGTDDDDERWRCTNGRNGAYLFD